MSIIRYVLRVLDFTLTLQRASQRREIKWDIGKQGRTRSCPFQDGMGVVVFANCFLVTKRYLILHNGPSTLFFSTLFLHLQREKWCRRGIRGGTRWDLTPGLRKNSNQVVTSTFDIPQGRITSYFDRIQWITHIYGRLNCFQMSCGRMLTQHH